MLSKYIVNLLLLNIIGKRYVTATDCPDRFLAYEGSCYLIAWDEVVDLVTAQNYCRQHGATLVYPTSLRQLQFLRDFMTGLKGKDFWVGITDETAKGIWQYYGTNRDINITDWAPSEPNSYNGKNEDCAVFDYTNDNKWADVSCTVSSGTVCQLRYFMARDILLETPFQDNSNDMPHDRIGQTLKEIFKQ